MNKEIFEGRKIMISQPMKGKTNEEIKHEREIYVKAITDLGGEVVDTVFASSPEEAQNKPLWYLSKAIEAMSTVDAMVFMPGWESARGCMIEHIIASSYGIPTLEIPDIETWRKENAN